MTFRSLLIAAASALALTASAGIASAKVELRYMCYGDGNDCEVFSDLYKRFEKENPDIKVAIETVPYKAILESLPVQLAAGSGPDMARVTDLGGLNPHYLDMRPHLKDPAYIETNFGSTLAWMRQGQQDKGIYGVMTQLTLTGPFINKTLFEQAKVPVPDAKATWVQWAEATGKVAKATETRFAIAMDRSGHRFAGPAISYGARYFDDQGKPIIDKGFRDFAEIFVKWHKDGIAPADVWAAAGGTTYRDAFEEFKNGNTVMFVSGSWQIQRLEKDVNDAFEWQAVPTPCGPAACSAMPGGAGLVAIKYTKHPVEVAKAIEFFAREDIHREFLQRTRNIPAHAGLAKAGMTYPGASPEVEAALKTFTASVPALAPAAYALQGYRFNRALLNGSVLRIGQVLNNEMTLDQAVERIQADVDTAVATGQQ